MSPPVSAWFDGFLIWAAKVFEMFGIRDWKSVSNQFSVKLPSQKTRFQVPPKTFPFVRSLYPLPHKTFFLVKELREKVPNVGSSLALPTLPSH